MVFYAVDFSVHIVGIVHFTCSYGFVTFEQQEDAEKLMRREVRTVSAPVM